MFTNQSVWCDSTQGTDESSLGSNINLQPNYELSPYTDLGSPYDQSPMSLGSPQDVNITSTYSYDSNMVAYECTSDGKPYLSITEQPQSKFRFRYKSEMHGTHGCIFGVTKTRNNKTHPTVQLRNYTGTAFIRCTLYSEDQLTLHPHSLVSKVGNRETPEPHDKTVNAQNDYIAEFPGIGILHTARKDVGASLYEKKKLRKLDELGLGGKISKPLNTQMREESDLQAKKVNLNTVCLCFEALKRDAQKKLIQICEPVFSNPIHNMKSAQVGDLKICRADRFTGSCRGGDEVFLFVEKVNKKNIKVRFFECDEDDFETWHAYGIFAEIDVHHQFAIVFKTPAYKDLNIEEPKRVFFELMRPSDGAVSEPKTFTYKPRDEDIYGPTSRKRPKQNSLLPFTTSDNPPSVEICGENVLSMTTISLEEYLSYLPDDNQETPGIGDALSSMMNPKNDQMWSDLKPDSTIKAHTKVSPSVPEAPCEEEKRKMFIHRLLRSLDLCKSKKERDVMHLLNDKANLPDGSNVFHTAAQYGQSQELRRLREALVNVPKPIIKGYLNSRNDKQQTALFISVLFDEPEATKELLELGADWQIEVKEKTALQLAIEEGRDDAFACFLQYVSPDYITAEGSYLLHEAVKYKKISLVSMLLQAGADPNVVDSGSESTPLHMAVKSGDVEIAKRILLDTRTKVDAENSAGYTPLHIACILQATERNKLCEILLKADANPMERTRQLTDDEDDESSDVCVPDINRLNINGENLGHTAFELAQDKPDVLRMLELRGEDVKQEILEDALDPITLVKVAEVLQKKGEWKQVARYLELYDSIPQFEQFPDPARRLLAGCLGQMTSNDLRDVFEKLGHTEAVAIIDDMLAG